MNESLRRFKEDRPEEYQEYRGYQRKLQQLKVQFIVACTVALSVVVGGFLLWGIVPALVLAVIALGVLIWFYRSQSHTRSTLRLSMVLMQLTFDDPSEVSRKVKMGLPFSNRSIEANQGMALFILPREIKKGEKDFSPRD